MKTETKIELGSFLSELFPLVEFIWDEDSKGFWTTDEDFLNTYSRERISYDYKSEDILKRKYATKFSQFRSTLIVNSDFDRIQITLD